MTELVVVIAAASLIIGSTLLAIALADPRGWEGDS